MSKPYLLEYKKPNIFKIGAMRFMPGVNEVTKEQWGELVQHPLLKARFDNGDLQWVAMRGPGDMPARDNKAGKPGKEENPLDGLDVKASVELVGKTVDKATLEKWLATDKRKPVVKAIESQLKKIAPSNPPKGKDKDDRDGD